jgi:hypothetical protein
MSGYHVTMLGNECIRGLYKSSMQLRLSGCMQGFCYAPSPIHSRLTLL